MSKDKTIRQLLDEGKTLEDMLEEGFITQKEYDCYMKTFDSCDKFFNLLNKLGRIRVK